MSYFDDASLVMIPSGYKDQKVYSVKPIDGTGDFTFSRGSDIEATRVNANGYIEKAKVNLLLQSNTFDTTWALSSGISLTSGQSGYDGTSDAWLLKRSDTSARYMYQNITQSAEVYTYSIYAKAETVDWIYLYSSDGTNNTTAYFDLATGALGTAAGNITSKIDSVGGGWYRCSVSYSDDITSVRIYPAVADGSITGGVSPAGVYIQDAQLNYGLVAQEYQETTTTSVVSGITNDLPRLDYSGGASCPSLLLEPQRTNLATHSEYFSGHTLVDISSTENATTSPEGVDNASKVIESAVTGAHEGYLDISCTTSTDYTISIFAKANTRNYFFLRFGGAGSVFTNSYVWYNLSTGSVGTIESGITANIEDYGNGWYRLTATRTSAATAFGRFFWGLADANGSKTYTGDGLSSAYAYGFQVEEGSYPTSYIPNYGLTSGATRLDDDMDTTFASPFATDGSATIFFHDLGVADSDGIISTAGRYRYQKDGDNYVSLTTNDTAWRVRIQGGGNGHFEGLNDHPKTSPIKVAVIVSSTHYSIFANGVKEIDNVALSATADFSSINDFLTFMQEDTGARRAVQHLIFPTALTDAEAIALTA